MRGAWSPSVYAASDKMDPSSAPSDIVSKFNAAAGKLAALALASEKTDVPEAIRTILGELGFKNVACLRFSVNTSDDVTLLSALATYSKDWQTRYFLRRYHISDPVIAYARSATQPFDWREVPHLSPEVEGFFEDARQHGVGANGITIPVRNRPNGLTLVSLTSDGAPDEWESLTREHIANLQLVAVLLDYLAGKTWRLPTSQISLSKREEQSLTWAARGKTVQEIADIMDVGYGSVRTYLDAARGKLKCVNVTHAVAVAIAVGIIPPQALKGTDPREFSEVSAA